MGFRHPDMSRSSSATGLSLQSASAQIMHRNSSAGPTVLNDVTNTTEDLPSANSVGTLYAKPGPHNFQPVNKSHKVSMSVASTSVSSASVASASAPLSPSNCTELFGMTPEYFDGDAAHEKDPQNVVEYLPEIYCRMRVVELKHIPEDFDYMKRQKEVTPGMRAILNDWLVDVHKKFKLRTETLFLTVDLVDRFLTRYYAKRGHLQLIGVTALLIASKFEEVYPPPVHEFLRVTDNAYKKNELVEMELSMLRVLDFQVCRPTSIQFLTRFQDINGCNKFDCCLTQFFLEMMLIEYAMVKYSPSRIAAAAVLLCNKIWRRNPCWTRAMEVHTGSDESSLKKCLYDMFEILKKGEINTLQAVRRKFGVSQYLNVSKYRFVDSREGRAVRLQHQLTTGLRSSCPPSVPSATQSRVSTNMEVGNTEPADESL